MLFRRALAAQFKRLKSSIAVRHFDDIPSPKGLPIIGTTLSLLAEGSPTKLHNYVDKRHKQLGPIYKERLGPVTAVFVADPDEIRAVFSQEGKFPMHLLPDAWVVYNQLYGCSRGLLFMDGDNWWYHRRIMNKLLLKGDFKWIESACECVSDTFIDNLNKTAQDDQYYKNLESTLYKWSLDVIVSVLLGAKTFKKHSKHLEEQTAKLADMVYLVFQTSAKLYLIPASVASKYKLPPWNRFVETVNDALKKATTLAGMLRDCSDPNDEGLLGKLLKEQIERENLDRIITDFILAAGDTTAVAMLWMLFVTGKHREIQDELRENPDFVKLVFKETLRLYPVAPFLTRILPEDSVLCGYGVPKGTIIVLSIFTTGRDERYFKRPNCFEPERWSREVNRDYSADMQKASLPFAIGLRACIGRKIAETQLQTTLLRIVNNFRVELCNKGDVDMKLKMVLVPSKPLQIKFKKL